MTIKINAYCIVCRVNVIGEEFSLTKTASGKSLHIGACSTCGYEIRRITD